MINDKIHSSHSKERVIVTYSFPGGSHNQTNTTTNLCKNNSFLPEGTYGCVGNLKIFGWASNESLYIAENRRTYTVRYNQFFVIVILFFIFDLHYFYIISYLFSFFFSINLLVFIPITASTKFMATYIGTFLFNAVLVFIFNFNFTFTFTFIFIFISIIFISLLL